MSDNARCCYCSRLPERRPGHGSRVQRCPLCKSEVGVAATGDAFRIVTTPAPSRHRLVGAIAVCGLVGVALTVAAAHFARSERPTVVAAAPETVHELPAPPRLEVVVAAAPVLHAESKQRGDAAPIARYKPNEYVSRSATKLDGPVFTRSAARFSDVKASPFQILRARVKQVGEPAFAPGWLDPATRSKESEALARVPEVRFESVTTKTEMLASFKRVAEKHAKGSDAFVDAVVKERVDLAGLPFLKGNACKSSTAAQQSLAVTANLLRNNLGVQSRIYAGRFSSDMVPPDVGRALVAGTIVGISHGRGSTSTSGTREPAEFLPAMMQILAAEPAGYRIGLAAQLEDCEIGDDAAIAALVRLALYDPEASVRDAAVNALRRESREKVGPKLIEGFRHPGRHVAEHAADAIVALELVEILPKLVDFLGEPDPSIPFERKEGDKTVSAVREMVKINHHRNCMLCHAPVRIESDLATDQQLLRSGLVARVPSEDEELPPSNSRVYYDVRRGNVSLVRANETYLRQDFTVLQPVDNSGKWPKMQRFDFLVRTRTLAPGEAPQQLEPLPAGDAPSPHHRAALFALSRLMWTYLGPKPDDWRQEVARRVREFRAER
jgi:hypothetical protein